MGIAAGSGSASRRSMWYMLSLFATLGLILAAAPRPARAGYDWCSVDPTIALRRAESGLAHLMDIQVLVPNTVLPMAGAALLNVAVPRNVTGTELLNTSTPFFEVKTTFAQHGSEATADDYKVELSLKMPPTTSDYPVRLLVIDQDTSQLIASKEGMASETLTMFVNTSALSTLVED